MEKKKINYYLVSLQELEEIKQKYQEKPTLLLHSCCGPCATFPVLFLSKYFRVTIIYNNSNIYPKEEYLRRKEELYRFLEMFQQDYGVEIPVIETAYDNDAYNADLEPFAEEPEGQHRCKICYSKRMKEAFAYADAHHFDYFTTVMTISRQKDSQVLNEIGKALQPQFSYTKYFFADFKKKKGIDQAREMRIQYGLYQQLYCGCKYTYPKQFEVLERRKKEQK